jgi:hypothetical protein
MVVAFLLGHSIKLFFLAMTKLEKILSKCDLKDQDLEHKALHIQLQ